MSRTLVFSFVAVAVLFIGSVSIWYALDDDSAVVTEGTSSSTDAPKKIINKLSGKRADPEGSDSETDNSESAVTESDVTTSDTVQTNEPVTSEVSEEDKSQGSIDKTEVVKDNKPDVSAEEPSDDVKTPAVIVDPSLAFDVIRVEKTGDTVLAGRAPAGSEVRIVDGTTLLGTVQADNNGQWAYVLETPLAPGAHELGLQVNNEEQGVRLKSADVAIVDVPKGDKSALAVLVPEDKGGASKIIQLPERVEDDGIKDGELALDSVDYDDSGQTVIGGTSQPGQKVVGYLNNEFVGQGVTDDEGRWTVESEKNVKEGLHQLRIDQVDDEGKVTARVEIPFSRSGKVESLPDERVVTVQPGNSLWRISRAIYGEGARYAVIYDRNQDQIRNPDLIYPGQIFVLPKEK
ncbi:LysM peptidoglycan-binding domain-containing protein [Kiloniella litopenaei]|uniref:LysM peptidoglycan-binding domain-containing protein n=1 Tax=Kiloniella litopenaei TaxID=1549748 RepID=UPI000696462A|nr:LysM peptidoglycan-binding domain-containing protein [Kiloniella litopenaei]